MKNLIGLIGFGEAAFHIANGLKSEGLDDIIAYDINQNHKDKGKFIRKRAEESGVAISEDLSMMCNSSKFLISLTSGKIALEVAKDIIPKLDKGQVYVDMNSAAPMVKEDIGKISKKDGVLVCDGAIMNTVPGNGHKVQIFLSGDGAEKFYNNMINYGMNLKVLNNQLGAASAIKMFRSVFMKGLPQLMFEAMHPAMKFGALDALVESLNGTLHGKTIEQLSNSLLARTMVHSERRAKEMNDVVRTLESMGLNADMSKSSRDKLQRLTKKDYIKIIGPEGKMDFKEALKVYDKMEEK